MYIPCGISLVYTWFIHGIHEIGSAFASGSAKCSLQLKPPGKFSALQHTVHPVHTGLFVLKSVACPCPGNLLGAGHCRLRLEKVGPARVPGPRGFAGGGRCGELPAGTAGGDTLSQGADGEVKARCCKGATCALTRQ